MCIWLTHDDVIKWKHFPRYWPFVRGIHRSPVTSPHKGQWRGALMFSLICVWINGWINNRETGDLRRYRALYDVTVMIRHLTPLIQPTQVFGVHPNFVAINDMFPLHIVKYIVASWLFKFLLSTTRFYIPLCQTIGCKLNRLSRTILFKILLQKCTEMPLMFFKYIQMTDELSCILIVYKSYLVRVWRRSTRTMFPCGLAPWHINHLLWNKYIIKTIFLFRCSKLCHQHGNETL